MLLYEAQSKEVRDEVKNPTTHRQKESCISLADIVYNSSEVKHDKTRHYSLVLLM